MLSHTPYNTSVFLDCMHVFYKSCLWRNKICQDFQTDFDQGTCDGYTYYQSTRISIGAGWVAGGRKKRICACYSWSSVTCAFCSAYIFALQTFSTCPKPFQDLHWIPGLNQLHFFFEVIGFSAFWTCWELFLFYSLSFWLFLFCFSFFPLALLLVVLPWVLPLFFTKKAPFASLFILKDLYCLVACTIFTSSVKVILEKSFDTSKEEILILSLWEIY